MRPESSLLKGIAGDVRSARVGLAVEEPAQTGRRRSRRGGRDGLRRHELAVVLHPCRDGLVTCGVMVRRLGDLAGDRLDGGAYVGAYAQVEEEADLMGGDKVLELRNRQDRVTAAEAAESHDGFARGENDRGGLDRSRHREEVRFVASVALQERNHGLVGRAQLRGRGEHVRLNVRGVRDRREGGRLAARR